MQAQGETSRAQRNASRWNFTVRLPRAVQRALKLYAVEHDTDLQEIGEEAITLWAAQKGTTLPSLSKASEERERG